MGGLVRRWCSVLAATVVLGCAQPPPPGGTCGSGETCAAPLVCVLGACRVACSALGACPAGTTCVADSEGRAACTLAAEESCGVGGCPSPLLCVEDHCRAPCRPSEPRCAPGSECSASGGAELCVPVVLDGGVPADAADAADAGTAPDSPLTDAGAPDAPRVPELPFCTTSGCESEGECFLGACETETVRRIGAEWAPVVGLPDGSSYLEVPAFVDGTCVTRTRAPFGSPEACQWFINAPTSECGACARCVVESDPATGYLSTSCRDRCDPTNPASCRVGYACDPITRTCQDACASDLQCRIYRVDSDDDGAADRLEYDPASQAFCNASGRCEEGGTTPVRAGEICDRHSECGAGGLCLGPTLLEDPNRSHECFELQCNAFTGGYCTHTGCREPGHECGEGEICTRGLELFGGTTDLCMRTCEVGAEPLSDRVGPMGHGLGCRPGYRCRFPGDAPRPAPGEPAIGTCNFGFYNSVTVPNVGAPCRANEECWSPFGSGICSALGFASVELSTACILDGCDAPGLPADFCGPDATCADFGANAFCLRNCTSASECAPGWGCLALGGAAGARVCISNCITAGDCRDGEGCYRPDAISVGTCVAGGTCGSPVDLEARASVQPDGSLHLIGSLGAEVHYGCGGGLPGTAVLYVPPADGVLLADAGGPMADGVILLRARGDCEGLAGDLACGLEGPSPSAIALRVEGGRPYYLMLDAGSPTSTTFDLTVAFHEVLRPGERCDASADACPEGFACTPSPAGDTICQIPDLGCGPGVPVATETSVTVGTAFGPPLDGALPTGSVGRISGSCAGGVVPSERGVVHPLVSPVDGVLTLVALANFDVTISARTACRTASSEVGCSAYDVGIAPPQPAAVLGAAGDAWTSAVPSRVHAEVRAGEPLYVIVEGAAPGGGYRLLSRVLPFREIGQTCDPLRTTDLCRRGSLCDAGTSTCVVRDEGCGPGFPVIDLTSLVPAGDDVRFVHAGRTGALSVFACPANPLIADTWHRVTLPGSSAEHWDYEIRAASGFAPVVRTTASCGPLLGAPSCARPGVLSFESLPGGSDLFFSVLPGPGADGTYEIEAHLTRVSVGSCGGAGDLRCARGLTCRAGVCMPVVCGDGIAEGGETCDSDPLCYPGCRFLAASGVGSASCAGVPVIPLIDSDPGIAGIIETSTLGDAPSIPTSCGGGVPARHYLIDVPVRSVLSAEATSFAGSVAVSVRTDCADPMSELSCTLTDRFATRVPLGTFDPGRYVVSVQFPGAGAAGTQGFAVFDLVAE